MTPSDLRSLADQLLDAYLDAMEARAPDDATPEEDKQWFRRMILMVAHGRRYGSWLHRTANRMDRWQLN